MRRHDKYLHAVHADLKGLEALVQEEKGAETAGLLEDLKEYKKAFEAYLAHMQKLGLTEEEGLTGEMRKSIHALEPLVDQVRERSIQASDEARRRLTFARLGVLGFSVALGAVLFFVLGRTVSKPIVRLREGV